MKKLFEDLIKQLIEIGRSETIPPTPEHSYLREGQWQRSRYPEDCDKYSYEDLKSLFKGVVLCEKEFEWQVGSVTNTDWIFRNLEKRLEYIEDYQERKKLYEFGFANRGDYPYVSANSGLRSNYENYKDYLKACEEAEIEGVKHSARILENHKATNRLSAANKIFKERAKQKRMEERAERKKERDKNVSIVKY